MKKIIMKANIVFFVLPFFCDLSVSTITSETLIQFTSAINIKLLDEVSEIEFITIESLNACFKHPRHLNKKVIKIPVFKKQVLPRHDDKDNWYRMHKIPPNGYEVKVVLHPSVPVDKNIMGFNVVGYARIKYIDYVIPYTGASTSQIFGHDVPEDLHTVPLSYLYYGLEAEIIINGVSTTISCGDIPYSVQPKHDEL